jgi:hypothetical protein
MCVQNFNDSRGLAIRITYRISLRSSSLWEPRHPLLKVVMSFRFQLKILDRCGNDPSAGSPTETLLRLHLPLNDKV